MGRSRMSSLKLALITLALCLIFTLRSNVSGKTRLLIIETKGNANGYDYQNDYQNGYDYQNDYQNGDDYQNDYQNGDDYHLDFQYQLFKRKGDDYALKTNDYRASDYIHK